MNFLKSKLRGVLDEENLNKQLKFYLYSQILVRSGGVIQKDGGDILFNPFLNVDRGSKVVVYSSGSFGQHILTTNIKTNFFQIINWIDVDFHKLNIGGTYVKPISSVNNDEFDSLIIATINPTNYKAIKKELTLMGIDEKKIAKIKTSEKEIDTLLIDLGFDEGFTYQKS